MAIEAALKKQIIEEHQQAPSDTGSPEVQVALQTKRIEQITAHLKDNKQDKHSRQGLLRLVNRRRKLLTYLERIDRTRYLALIKRLGLRR